MPAILRKKLIISSALGILFGILGMHFFSPQHLASEKRDLASLNSKFDKLPGLAQMQSKHLSAISVRLIAPDEIPEDSQNDIVQLNATVVLNQGPSQDIDIDWNLPNDAVIISGEKSFKISNAMPGQIYPVSIIISGFNKTDKKLVLVAASFIRDGIKLGSSSLISSRPEDSMEYLAPEMAEAASEIGTAPQEGKVIK